MSKSEKWYLGSMNDGLFIINRQPSPNATDFPPHDEYGPDVALNVVALTEERAQAIVDAHNAAIQPKRQQAAMDERAEFEKWYVKRFNYAGKFPIELTPRDECRFEGFIAGFQARASLGHELTGVGE